MGYRSGGCLPEPKWLIASPKWWTITCSGSASSLENTVYMMKVKSSKPDPTLDLGYNGWDKAPPHIGSDERKSQVVLVSSREVCACWVTSIHCESFEVVGMWNQHCRFAMHIIFMSLEIQRVRVTAYHSLAAGWLCEPVVEGEDSLCLVPYLRCLVRRYDRGRLDVVQSTGGKRTT